MREMRETEREREKERMKKREIEEWEGREKDKKDREWEREREREKNSVWPNFSKRKYCWRVLPPWRDRENCFELLLLFKRILIELQTTFFKRQLTNFHLFFNFSFQSVVAKRISFKSQLQIFSHHFLLTIKKSISVKLHLFPFSLHTLCFLYVIIYSVSFIYTFFAI